MASPTNSVAIFLKVAQTDGLGTDVTPREGVSLVATDARDATAFGLDLDPTGGFAERAAGVAGSSVHGIRIGELPSGTFQGRAWVHTMSFLYRGTRSGACVSAVLQVGQ